MARRALSAVVEQARIPASRTAPDAELLEQFLRTRDEAAFAALVHRHRPIVFAACRQVLVDDADVEDAAPGWLGTVSRSVTPAGPAGSPGLSPIPGAEEGFYFGLGHPLPDAPEVERRRRPRPALGHGQEADADGQ